MACFSLRFLKFLFVAAFAAVALLSHEAPAREKEPRIIIRDAEIEAALKSWLEPLAKTAGMDPAAIRIVIVQNPQINAFVAGGANIFLYSGLLEKTENPGEVIGVMAHELGHIAGGHLVAGRDAFERASYESILGTVLGIGAAIATGKGDAVIAGTGAGGALAQSHYLAHSRVQESSADQAALRFLEGSRINPSGLLSFLEKIESEELLPAGQQSPYMRTHPMTRDRISSLEVKADASPFKGNPYPESWNSQHARMKAKLSGFINPGKIPWMYDDGDVSTHARYARAIAAYRENRVAEAMKYIDGLLALEPQNPYFLELKAQALVDFGRVNDAIPYYRQASAALPNSGLIRIAYAHALMEAQGEERNLMEAVEHLERALRDEPRSTEARRLLATAYGQMGQENTAKLHLAEEAVLQRRLKDAKALAGSVQASAAKGSREALQARDILRHISVLKKENGGDED